MFWEMIRLHRTALSSFFAVNLQAVYSELCHLFTLETNEVTRQAD